jgi:hypothetical protein
LVERRGALTVCWNTRFEDVPPVRSFPSYKGQRNFPGLYFAACMSRHVGFESWLERDQLSAPGAPQAAVRPGRSAAECPVADHVAWA